MYPASPPLATAYVWSPPGALLPSLMHCKPFYRSPQKSRDKILNVPADPTLCFPIAGPDTDNVHQKDAGDFLSPGYTSAPLSLANSALRASSYKTPAPYPTGIRATHYSPALHHSPLGASNCTRPD